jgi:DNA polymerase-3 subunit gamma/tau
MFSKLSVTQPELTEILKSSIESDTFSNSSLFCSPSYSSKMTAAIEVAKALSCFTDKKGDDCDCESCKAYDNYLMQNLVVISNRDFENRIDVAIQSFVKNRDSFSKDYLIKTIRIFLLSYHNGVYTDKNKKLFDCAYEVSELINDFSKNGENFKIREAQRFAKELKQKLKPLISVSNKNLTALSVDGVRSLQTWVSNTLVNEKARIVVIEAIEKSNDSVRNSLLKILEEPNDNVYFILLSNNPSRIIKTILSRVRKYNFLPIDEQVQKQLLKPFKIEDETIDTFEKFFLTASGYKSKDVEGALDVIVESVIKKRQLTSEQLASVIKALDSSNQDEFILHQLLSKIKQKFLDNEIDNLVCKNIIKDVSLLYNNQRVFNLPKKNMYENVYRKMMENINA